MTNSFLPSTSGCLWICIFTINLQFTNLCQKSWGTLSQHPLIPDFLSLVDSLHVHNRSLGFLQIWILILPAAFSFWFTSMLFSSNGVETVGEWSLKFTQSPLAIQEYDNVSPFLYEFKFNLINKVWISQLLSPPWQVVFSERARSGHGNSFKRLGLW